MTTESLSRGRPAIRVRRVPASLAAIVLVGAAQAHAGIELGPYETALYPEPSAPVVRLTPMVPAPPHELVVGGIPLGGGAGASLLPFIAPRFPSMAPPRPIVESDTARAAAHRAALRAHAFSGNLYREVRKGEPLPWYSPYVYTPYRSW